jgi:hypothetical protein
VVSIASLGAFFFFLLMLLLAPFIILYFLPYGFMVNKSFTQMPGHIKVMGGILYTFIFSTPVIISVVMYIKLTLAVKMQDIVPGIKDKPPETSSNLSNLKITSWHKNIVTPNNPRNVAVLTLNTINENSSESSDIHILDTVNVRTKNNTSSIQPTTHPHPDRCPDGPEDQRSSLEIEAALRSMKTNLLMLLLFFFHCFLLLIPSDRWRMLGVLIVESLLKFLLPTVTTISNFGPVKEPVALYLQQTFCTRRVSSA